MKTLADKIIEAAANKRFDVFTRQLAQRAADEIQSAQRFVVDEDVHDATRDLLRSRPSTLIAAAQFARPPFDKVWIEWPSPNQPEPKHIVRIRTQRIGALITAVPESKGRAWSFWTAWSYDLEESASRYGRGDWALGAGVIDPADFRNHLSSLQRSGLGISSTEAAFDLDRQHYPDWIRPARNTLESMRASRDDAYNNLRYAIQDPREAEAVNALLDCLRWRCRPDKLSQLQMEVCIALGQPGATAALDDVRDEIGPLLGLLIMLNSRNGVETQRHEPDPGLVKMRLKRGNKPPPVAYSVVRIRLNRRERMEAAEARGAQVEIARHKVRGHFKVRKSGVFWWRDYSRGHGAAHDHRYEITP